MASSYLFSLPLRGVGTADVESLSSYLCRLSAAHSASVKDVIEHASLWLRRTNRPDIAMPFVTRSPESLAYYVRPNGMTRLLAEALAAATQRSDLRCGTFLALELAVSRCMGTFDRAVRWCPQCIRDFVEADDEGYMKLQWQLCDVARCSSHGVMLLDKCPHCQRHQNGCARRERVTHCVFCKRQLAPVTGETPGPGSWKIESADLIEVVDELASKPMLTYPAEGPRTVLTELFDRVWKREEDLRLWKMVSRDEVLSVIDGTTPVSLKTARRLAFQLGIRLVDMLAGTLAQTTGVLDDAWTAKLPASMRPKRRAARRDRVRLMVALEDAVRRDRLGNPDSLRHVARSLGVSTGCLTYHFPELARELLTLHASWRRAEKERKRLQARAAVLRQLARSESDRPHSHKAMLRVLRATTKLPKEVLRRDRQVHLAVACHSSMGLAKHC